MYVCVLAFFLWCQLNGLIFLNISVCVVKHWAISIDIFFKYSSGMHCYFRAYRIFHVWIPLVIGRWCKLSKVQLHLQFAQCKLIKYRSKTKNTYWFGPNTFFFFWHQHRLIDLIILFHINRGFRLEIPHTMQGIP